MCNFESAVMTRLESLWFFGLDDSGYIDEGAVWRNFIDGMLVYELFKSYKMRVEWK